MPGGNPVTAKPGLTPRSPMITVGPVLVTVDDPSTAKLSTVPRVGAVAALAKPLTISSTSRAAPRMAKRERVLFFLISCLPPDAA